jgi:membrane protein
VRVERFREFRAIWLLTLGFELWTAGCYVANAMSNATGSRLKRLYQAIYEFLTEKWIETHEEAQISWLQRFAHFWLLVFKSFSRNRCPLRATALAYTTLLALVPLLAVGFGIASSLIKERGPNATREMIERFVDTAIPQLKLVPEEKGTPSARDTAIMRIVEFINNTQSGSLSAWGAIGLIAVGIMLLSTIEGTFNDIWGVTRGRSWLRRIVQYWTTISLGPLVLALLIAHVGNALQTGPESAGVLATIFRLLPSFILVSLAFAVLYKLMPNTQVHWMAASVGGVMGGSLWLFLNILNAINLSRVVGMSKIYGTAFALVPIFLLGLYFSWLIVLFGAQVAYAFQNRLVYVQEKKAESVSQRGREYVALRVMTFVAQRFDRGEKPPTMLEISTELGVPSRLVGRVLAPLLDARLTFEIFNEKESAYAPGRPIETITCHDVLFIMRAGAGQELETRDDPSRVFVCSEFERIQQAERQAGRAVTLKDLVARISTRPPAEPLKPEIEEQRMVIR